MMDEERARSTGGSGLAWLVAGVAAGVLGSRLLPPILAWSSASMRAKAGGDPFDMLIEDHRKIMSLLDTMASQPADAMAKRSGAFLMLKRKLAKHALAEEDVVYPMLHNEGSDPQGSKHLYDEHADMKIHLFELEQRIRQNQDWSQQVRELRDLIAGHVEDEEQRVFPLLRQKLGQNRAPSVSGLIHREEAMIL